VTVGFHVKSTRGGPAGHQQAAVGHGGGRAVRVLPPAPAPPGRPLPGGRPGCGRAPVPQAAEQPAGDRGQGPRVHRQGTARADRGRLGRRARDHRLAPGASRTARPVDLDDPPGPARRRPGHPEPRKRPRSSYKRFEAAQPNECWQSDFTHWALDGGADAEIINWLDDHSRYLLGCSAHAPVTGKVVVDTFLQASNTHGLPAATLTDNGRVYTARFGGGRNAFEYLLAALGITQKNGHPFHPQTQGKVERFHQTQKLWLAAQPPAATLAVLQAQLDVFRGHYNEDRPNRAVQRQTPGQAYRARPKAWPASAPSGYYRLRYDHVDKGGKVSIRRAGRMHHLGIGIAHTGKEILAITDTATATVIELRTGEVLSVHDIDPARAYWRDKQRSPGRWPGPSVT
jgi:transposase InsO family protein